MSKIKDSIIDVPVVDLSFEHETHSDEWLKNCSLCYKEKISELTRQEKEITTKFEKIFPTIEVSNVVVHDDGSGYSLTMKNK